MYVMYSVVILLRMNSGVSVWSCNQKILFGYSRLEVYFKEVIGLCFVCIFRFPPYQLTGNGSALLGDKGITKIKCEMRK